MVAFFVAAVPVAFHSATPAIATPGDLDTSFGDSGLEITDAGGNDSANAVAIQPADGKIVVAGSSNGDFLLSRYESDGTPDETFGGGKGWVTTPISPGDDVATSVTIDTQGRIVVGGYSPDGQNEVFVLARYNGNGTLDVSGFGAGRGIVTTLVELPPPPLSDGTTEATSSRAQGLAMQGDQIVAVGRACARQTVHGNFRTQTAFALVRYNADGSLDSQSFGEGGIVLTQETTSNNCDAQVFNAVATDGDLIVAAGTMIAGGSPQFAVARYLRDGILDPDFSGPTPGGKVQMAQMGAVNVATAIAVQPDRTIVAAGYSLVNDYDFALARFLPLNGSSDRSFGTSGTAVADFGGSADFGTGVALQPDGKIIVAGTSNDEFALARFTDKGALDTSFGGGDGLSSPAIQGSTQARGVALTECNVVAAGVSGTDVALARYRAFDPGIDDIKPDSEGPSTGGTPIRVSGSCFHKDTTVDFGGVSAKPSSVDPSGKTMAIKTPAHAVGTAKVTVDGSDPAAAAEFRFLPAVSGVVPPTGKPEGGEEVAIQGRGFANATDVTFGGLPAEILAQTDTAVVVKTPPHDPGPARVVVTIGSPEELSSVTVEGAPLANLFTYVKPLPLPPPTPDPKDTGGIKDNQPPPEQPALPTGGTGGSDAAAPSLNDATAPGSNEAAAPGSNPATPSNAATTSNAAVPSGQGGAVTSAPDSGVFTVAPGQTPALSAGASGQGATGGMASPGQSSFGVAPGHSTSPGVAPGGSAQTPAVLATQGSAAPAPPAAAPAPPPASPAPGNVVLPGAPPASPAPPPAAAPRNETAPGERAAPAGGTGHTPAPSDGGEKGGSRYAMVRSESDAAVSVGLGLGAAALSLSFGFAGFCRHRTDPKGHQLRWAVASHARGTSQGAR